MRRRGARGAAPVCGAAAWRAPRRRHSGRGVGGARAHERAPPVVGRDDAAAIAGVAGVAGGAARAPSRASSCATLVDAAQAARAAEAAKAQQAREIAILREAYDAQQVLLFVNGTPKGYSRPRFRT